MLVHGYHLGIEDQGVYLPGIKQLLDPGIYPYDANFFLVQLQATLFDELIAGSVRLTHLPLVWTLFLWHLGSIFLLLLGCRAISRRCFREPAAQWAAVGTVAALLTLPTAVSAKRTLLARKESTAMRRISFRSIELEEDGTSLV